MVVFEVPVNGCNPVTIVLGRRGTYNTQEVTFDLSYLVENYGAGTAALMVKRSQDTSSYPAVVSQEGNTLTWVVSDVDTYYPGSGECELMWYVDEGLAKTIIYPLVVMRDILQTTEEPPDRYENWIEHLTELGAETQQNAQAAAQSATEAKDSADAAEDALEKFTTPTASATTLEPGAPATAEYNDGNFEFGIPRGETGATGPQGPQGIQGETGPQGPKGDKLTYADLTEADKEDLVQGPIKAAQDTAVEAVNTAGNTQKNAVNQAGTTQVQNVNSAGSTQVNNVNQAGTTQVGNVNQAGTTQIQAVEDKGAEVLDSIPADYTELSNAVFNDVTGLDTKAPVIIDTASGAIATFTDGANGMPIKKLVAQIEPVQDLHGYDSPWPAGGGKNKFDGSTVTTENTSNWGITWDSASNTLTIVHKTSYTTGTPSCAVDLPDGTYVISGTFGKTLDFSRDGTWVKSLSNGSAFTIESGHTYRIEFQNTEATTLTYKNVMIESGSTATSYAPYENICPISGYTGAEVYDDPAYGGTINWNQGIKTLEQDNWISESDVTATFANGVVTLSSTVQNNGIVQNSQYTAIANHKYFIQSEVKGTADQMCRILAAGRLSINMTVTTDNTWEKKAAILNPAESGRGNVYIFGIGGAYSNISIRNPQLIDLTEVFGSIVADYIYNLEQTTAGDGVAWFRNLFPNDYYSYNTGEETTVSAVNGDEYNQISVTFPSEAGTVYGGTLTLNPDRTGTLVVDMAKHIINGTEATALSQVMNDEVYRIGIAVPEFFVPNNAQERLNVICNMGPATGNILGQATHVGDCLLYNLSGNTIVLIGVPIEYSSSSAVAKQWLVDNGYEFVSKLADPQTIQLTAEQVSGILETLYGTNNIWVDTGDIEVTYPADTKLYIDRKIAEALGG